MKCLENIDKDQVREMSFEELQVLVESIKKEQWMDNTKREIINALDVRDADGPRIIEAKFEGE